VEINSCGGNLRGTYGEVSH